MYIVESEAEQVSDARGTEGTWADKLQRGVPWRCNPYAESIRARATRVNITSMDTLVLADT